MEISRRSRLGNYPNSFFGVVCVRKTLTHYKSGFGWFKSVLWFVLEESFPVKESKKP